MLRRRANRFQNSRNRQPRLRNAQEADVKWLAPVVYVRLPALFEAELNLSKRHLHLLTFKRHILPAYANRGPRYDFHNPRIAERDGGIDVLLPGPVRVSKLKLHGRHTPAHVQHGSHRVPEV